MYAHQVIEDLTNYPENKIIVDGSYNVEWLKTKITNAAKFHGPDFNVLSNIFSNEKGSQLFIDNADELKLPYKRTWVDYYAPMTSKKLTQQSVKSTRGGILALDLGSKKYNLIYVNSFTYFDDYKKWMHSGIHQFVLVGEKFSKFKYIDELAGLPNLQDIKGINSNVIYSFYSNEVSNRLSENEKGMLVKDTDRELEYLHLFLLLLNCKNIEQKVINAPLKLNKKRESNGKEPIYKYKVLEIAPMNKKGPRISFNPGSGNPVALHRCRGHFKVYTPRAPLFGKLTGRYWWHDQIRGNEKNGVVEKEYKVAAN